MLFQLNEMKLYYNLIRVMKMLYIFNQIRIKNVFQPTKLIRKVQKLKKVLNA